MKKNVGSTDRIIRIVLGLIIVAIGIIYESWWGAIGLVLFLTAAVGVCPVYMPLRISTCKVAQEEKK